MRLSDDAVLAVYEAGLTVGEYSRRVFGAPYVPGTWPGDSCGCPDDRCRGFHHRVDDECGCLRALLRPEPVAVTGLIRTPEV